MNDDGQVDSKPAERTSEPSSRADPTGPGCLTLLLLVLPFVIAWNVVTIADGSYQVDAWAPAFFVLIVWLAASISAIAVVWVIRSSGARARKSLVAVGISVVLVVAAIVITANKTANDAPDGSDFDITLNEAETAVANEVADALTAVVGNDWNVQSDPAFFRSQQPCLDLYGRDRGASTSSQYWVLRDRLDQETMSRLIGLLERSDRRVLQGEPFVPWDASSEFVYVIDEIDGQTRLAANIPCLAMQ